MWLAVMAAAVGVLAGITISSLSRRTRLDPPPLTSHVHRRGGADSATAAVVFLSWPCAIAGVSIELRDARFDRIWLRRGADELQLELAPEERVIYPIVAAANAPIAYALIFRRPSGRVATWEYARVISIILPDSRAPLGSTRVDTVEMGGFDPRQAWIAQLEEASIDGERLLVRRADRVLSPTSERVTMRTFRLEVRSKVWIPIEA